MSVIDEIFTLFAKRGAAAYFGESISMTQHMLQTAHFAVMDHAPAHLVVAALLHDLGHLLEEIPADIGDWKTDARHEEVGARWLSGRFGPEITNPIRLHVPAKRYLCASDPAYRAMLSPASAITLELQGGPMSPYEIGAFESQPFARDAVSLRRWDDRGKIAGLETTGLEAYREIVGRSASSTKIRLSRL